MHMVGFERLLKHLIQNDKLPLNPYLRPMDKIALQKGLQRVFYGILAAFIGPVVIMQAFQNEGHPWYWPVLLIWPTLLLWRHWVWFLGNLDPCQCPFRQKKEGIILPLFPLIPLSLRFIVHS